MDDGSVNSLELEGAENLELLDDLEISDLDESNTLDGDEFVGNLKDSSNYTKIPSQQTPILANKKKKSSVIPIAAGLSVAAAAGLGAKAYIDHRKNSDTSEDEYEEDDEFETEDWDDDSSYETGYEVIGDNTEQEELEEDYSYSDDESESYSARSNQELSEV